MALYHLVQLKLNHLVALCRTVVHADIEILHIIIVNFTSNRCTLHGCGSILIPHPCPWRFALCASHSLQWMGYCPLSASLPAGLCALPLVPDGQSVAADRALVNRQCWCCPCLTCSLLTWATNDRRQSYWNILLYRMFTNIHYSYNPCFCFVHLY